MEARLPSNVRLPHRGTLLYLLPEAISRFLGGQGPAWWRHVQTAHCTVEGTPLPTQRLEVHMHQRSSKALRPAE